MEPLAAPEQCWNRARRILAVAAIIHLALFVLQSRGTLAALVARRPVTTGACVSGVDGRGYYAWLRSPLIDGDFHFDDEFAPLFAGVPESRAPVPVSTTGHVPNPWSVGPALAWSPAVVTLHLILSGLGGHSPWPTDGYSPPYQLAVGGTTLALALLTLVLAYRIGRCFGGPTAAAAAAALITVGTPVVAYGAVEVSMSHGPATAALTLFVLVWLRTFGSTRLGRWTGLGCLLGLVCLMRWQLATFAVLPALEAIWLATRAESWSARIGAAARLAVTGLACVVVFTPQFVAKQIVYGHPLGGLHHTAQNWLDPSLWTVLGSTDRSLFYWTPITLPALAGLMYVAFRTRRPVLVILATAVAVQIYTISALLGGEAFLGASFGFRFLTETCILMVPGAVVLFDRANPRTARGLVVGGGLLAGWNLLLLGVYRCAEGGTHGGNLAAMVAMVGRHVWRRPLDGLGMLAAAGWLTYTLVRAIEYDRGHPASVVPDRIPPQVAA